MFKYKILVTETGIHSGKHRKEQKGIDNIVDKVDIFYVFFKYSRSQIYYTSLNDIKERLI